MKKILSRAGITLGILLLCLLIFLIGAVTIVFRGPSVAARDLLVTTVMETSAAKFVARLYFSEEEIGQILAGNTVVDTGEVTDSSLIESPKASDSDFDLAKIELLDVSGPTFKGKMLVVNDPSRVYVGSPAAFGKEEIGIRVEEMIRRDGAIAGVNAGGFEDLNGVGNGGTPLGIVIQNGVVTWNAYDPSHVLIGFDRDDKLIVGKMTAQEAMKRGLRDAVTFFPALVINGEPVPVSGSGGGLNPRTAIGQRADGAVLLLAIDGRQAHSIGA
ncbi:MAG: phosphodiester glycosidase family protein, partial [Oscillospiraceae bacterium]